MKIASGVVQWNTRALQLLAAKNGDVRHLIVCTPDGFEVASAHNSPISNQADLREHTARLATMTSSLAAVGHAVVEETEIGPQRSLIVDALGGKLIVLPFSIKGYELILALLANSSATVGSVFVLAKQYSLNAQNYQALSEDGLGVRALENVS
jgi:uncharacterized protein